MSKTANNQDRKTFSDLQAYALYLVFSFLGGLVAFGVIDLIHQFQKAAARSPYVQKEREQKAETAAISERVAVSDIHPDDPELGYKLMQQSDCLTCHALGQKLVGPSFREMAAAYSENSGIMEELVAKVKQGGGGKWGALVMTPHPGLKDDDIHQMIHWILSRTEGPATAIDDAGIDLENVVAAMGLRVSYVDDRIDDPDPHASVWDRASDSQLSLTAQPMAIPRPKTTTTPEISVAAVHDGNRVAFRLRWQDPDYSTAGILGTFSDAVALQFPVKSGKTPPPITMGSKEQPVHVYHWRAQYQADREQGFHTMKDLYPNMSVDIYPLEFAFIGKLPRISHQERETFAVGQAVGNPQSFRKVHGIDEIVAEGFGTSAVIEDVEARAAGAWADNQWTVVITRPLKTVSGSALNAGESGYVAVAVWQGGLQEVGSRKSVTLKWIPLELAPQVPSSN